MCDRMSSGRMPICPIKNPAGRSGPLHGAGHQAMIPANVRHGARNVPGDSGDYSFSAGGL